MLRITQLSGEELATIPLAEVDNVRSLKLRSLVTRMDSLYVVLKESASCSRLAVSPGRINGNLGLHQRHGLPTRFRQKLVHEGRTLDDDEKLDTAMDLTAPNLKPQTPSPLTGFLLRSLN